MYKAILLDMPNITVKCCTVRKPATLLPIEGDRELHDCEAITNQLSSPRLDLKREPLHHPDLILYVDGSVSHNLETGKNK